MVTVTVNGKSVEQYIGEEKSREIQDFLRGEVRSLRRWTSSPIISRPAIKNVSRPSYKADGRVEVR